MNIKIATISILMLSNLHASAGSHVRLFHLQHSVTKDNFYTVSEQVRDAVVAHYGYIDKGAVAWVEEAPIASPFKRFWKGPPQNEHFYTSSESEADFVRRQLGYIYEGVEGYIYETLPAVAAHGLVPLYRLHKYNRTSGDVKHYYTTSQQVRDSMKQSGWTLDGINGYVWDINTKLDPFAPFGYSSCPSRSAYSTYPCNSYLAVPGHGDTRFLKWCAGSIDVYKDGVHIHSARNFTIGTPNPLSGSQQQHCYSYWSAPGPGLYTFEFSGWTRVDGGVRTIWKPAKKVVRIY